MKNSEISSTESVIKNWWISLIIGILFVVFSFWMLATPGATFEALIVLFSVFMFISGVFEIAFAISNSKSAKGWGWYLIVGIIDLLLGGYLMFHPGLMALIIPFIIALWLMFRGFSTIGLSMDAQQIGIKGWGWYLTFGILAVICSIMIIWQPIAGVAAAIYMTAAAFLFIGIFRIIFALGLRKVRVASKKR